MNVSLHIFDTLGQNMAYKATGFPLEKRTGGILNNAHFIQRLHPRIKTLCLEREALLD